MNSERNSIKIKIIPVNEIAIVNPRVRNNKVFRQIIDSIATVGLKKPITVNQNKSRGDDSPKYNLVCGQGRLEAVISLGQSEIPAIISDVSDEDGLIMSLVENLARRRHQPLELLSGIGELSKRGFSEQEIAAKIGLSRKYVRMICLLLDDGEERLLVAVESGHIPISVAIEIAEADEEGAQEALAQAYQDGHLRGKKLIIAKRLIEQRQRRGITFRPGKFGSSKSYTRLSSVELVRAYKQEADRQRMMIKKAEITQNQLLFIVEAMRQLISDENFVTLLRAENLASMPRTLADLTTTHGSQ
jgi:ParB family chromosome partitioning protein